MRKVRAWRDGSVAQIAVQRGPESSETAVNTGIFVVRGAAVSHHGRQLLLSPREPPMTAEAIRPAARRQPWYKILYV
jgi:hypothetical protein